MVDIHQFDVGLAKRYGLVEAIILSCLQRFIRAQIAHDDMYYGERTWIDISIEELHERHLPFIPLNQLEKALKRLVRQKVLRKKDFAETDGLQTWWAFEKEEQFISCDDLKWRAECEAKKAAQADGNVRQRNNNLSNN